MVARERALSKSKEKPMNRPSKVLPLMIVLTLLASGAHAHEGSGLAGGFVSGFLHPLLGWDHVVAMVAVGLWGAFLGMPALWILPVVFPLVMAFGGALGVLGVPLPAVEVGIALSALVLGVMVASFMAMRMAPNCRMQRARSPTASASSSRPVCCT
jgi:urease accessory protein